MLVNEAKMRVVQKTLAALLAVIFGFASFAQTASRASGPSCHCCADAMNDLAATPCSPSCCEAPVREEPPAAPASVPSDRAGDWQSVPPLILEQVALDGSAISLLPKPSVSFLRSRAVPIFQRDCSYLI